MTARLEKAPVTERPHSPLSRRYLESRGIIQRELQTAGRILGHERPQIFTSDINTIDVLDRLQSFPLHPAIFIESDGRSYAGRIVDTYRTVQQDMDSLFARAQAVMQVAIDLDPANNNNKGTLMLLSTAAQMGYEPAKEHVALVDGQYVLTNTHFPFREELVAARDYLRELHLRIPYVRRSDFLSSETLSNVESTIDDASFALIGRINEGLNVKNEIVFESERGLILGHSILGSIGWEAPGLVRGRVDIAQTLSGLRNIASLDELLDISLQIGNGRWDERSRQLAGFTHTLADVQARLGDGYQTELLRLLGLKRGVVMPSLQELDHQLRERVFRGSQDYLGGIQRQMEIRLVLDDALSVINRFSQTEVTPASFSDGNGSFDIERAVAIGLRIGFDRFGRNKTAIPDELQEHLRVLAEYYNRNHSAISGEYRILYAKLGLPENYVSPTDVVLTEEPEYPPVDLQQLGRQRRPTGGLHGFTTISGKWQSF